MKVVITSKLLKFSYDDGKDCPLYHALKEQYPDLSVSRIGWYGNVHDKKDNIILQPSGSTHWSLKEYTQLKEGKLELPYIIELVTPDKNNYPLF